MKSLLILVSFIWAFSISVSGQVDSVVIDGNQYYVYPFKQSVDVHDDYWIAVDDKEFYLDYKNYFDYFEPSPNFSKEKFEKAKGKKLARLNRQLKNRWKNKRAKNGRVGLGKDYVRQVRKNPGPLFEVKYTANKEVLPPFGNIPDGNYVQLFSDLCLVDENGMCQPSPPAVAGYFKIKNNVIDGHAVWLTYNGDTLKQGNFSNGLKEGTWTISKVSKLPSTLYRWSLRNYKNTGRFDRDTGYYMADYHLGVKHGKYFLDNYSQRSRTYGSFTQGEASGLWEIYDGEQLLMKANFAEKSDSSISFVPIIRTGELIRSYDYSKFDMEAAEYQLMNPPTEFYSINFALDGADLELEEEQFQSHELEYHRYGFDDEEIPDRVLERFRENGAYNFLPLEKDPKTEHVETRGYFIDSIGTKMLFQGDYELYYPNGQLFTRYNFGKGKSLYEDTLFWDSGAPHDVIIYLSDSNHYERTIYDYDGVPVRTAVYDSLGDFRNFIIDLDKEEEILIEGITASRINKSIDLKFNKDSVLRGNFEYRNWGAAKDSLHEKEIFYKLWSGYDSSVLAQTTYDPATKTLLYSENSYAGNTFAQINRKFTEDFQGWTSNSIWKYGDFELRRTSSGILEEFQNDTFPQRHVSSSYTDYDVTNDYVLYLKGEKYTGKGNIKFNKPRFKSSGSKMKTSYSRYLNYGRVKRPVYKYYRTGKIKNSDLFGVTNTIYGVNGIQRSMFYDLYSDVLGDFFSYGGSGGYYSDYGMYEKGGVKKVKGRMVNGKPQGVWKSKSMNGKVMGEIAFIDGEAQGVFKSYAYEPRATRWQRKYSEEELPKKRIYYLHSTVNYENGLKNGDLRVYDWKGELKQKGTYVDDYLEGAYLERYSMAYSVSNYNRGMLDGYVQTYLTLPNRDTMLLYDLNFQHDLLNGESIAYHTNGRVAKRGFFLDGEPIDDYEAYDTLGFKYHYVKFKYSYPVEEKIWEENELSLRYKFNWEDSIPFDPSDITETMSLNSLMYNLGYGLDHLQEQYYGRPRLIDKEGLTYHMTKFYPNDTIARIGNIDDGKKIGDWDFFSYEGEFLYEVNYFDSIIVINDSVRFKSKGIITDYDSDGKKLYKGFIIEKTEKYDCAHTDHYEIRQISTIWEAHDSIGRMNGYAKNYYDNGVLQNEGYMKDGLPTGLWKFYDPYGKLNLMGSYHQGKRHGRWLAGDLSKKKYLGEICLNPDLPDLEEEIEYRENLLDVEITNYWLGKAKNRQFYDLNLNKFTEFKD